MNDDECILVEFSNENRKISVAFQNWIQWDDDHTKTDLINKAIIEKDVKLKWPNVDIEPSKSMNRRRNKIEWSDVVWDSESHRK